MIDLRSDTVTLPTRRMREAILDAPLGDDVFGEDETVNRLEEIAASKTGFESAMLVTSGTQANITSVLTHTRRGDELICEAESHMYFYEVGGISALAGVIPHTVVGEKGILDPSTVERAIRPKNIHMPPTTLICIENTHNRAGGTITSPERIAELEEVAKRHNCRLYMDGARIFNAAVATGRDVQEFCRHTDSMMFCLSKGLSAPVGSLVCGSKEFVERARKYRKMLGGAMRQAGIIAACGIVALEEMVPRLAEDHANARILARGIHDLGYRIELDRVQTNIVVFEVSPMTSQEFIPKLEKEGVKCVQFGETTVRMVTHYGIEEKDIRCALEALEKVRQ
jgi:threonine aldolase